MHFFSFSFLCVHSYFISRKFFSPQKLLEPPFAWNICVNPGGGSTHFLGGCANRFPKIGYRERIFLEKWGVSVWERKFASWVLKFWPKRGWKCISFQIKFENGGGGTHERRIDGKLVGWGAKRGGVMTAAHPRDPALPPHSRVTLAKVRVPSDLSPTTKVKSIPFLVDL